MACYIDFQCVQQDLRRADDRTVAAGATCLEARFDLCPKWDGLSVYAHFERDGAVPFDVQLEDGCAEIPAEMVQYTGFFVSVYGADGSGGILTSARVFVKVDRSIEADGVLGPLKKTPSLLERLEAKIQKIVDTAAALRADADAGRFDGDPFKVSHVFGSVAEMEAHEGAAVGAFAVINSGADQEDNGRVYQREADGWLFLADMSGLPGKDGLNGDAAVLGAKISAEDQGGGTWVFGVKNTTDLAGVPIPVPVESGGTGATDAQTARENIGAAAADHAHDGVYSKEDHTHSLSGLGAAAADHGHGIEDLEGVAAEDHEHSAADVSDMADHVTAQGVTPITIDSAEAGSVKWIKFESGLAIVDVQFTKGPISGGITTANGGLYASDSAKIALPFTMAKANAFGSVPGWLYEVRTRVTDSGASLSFNYRNTISVSDISARLPSLTVIGRWK